jgi:hypothetical protein
LLQESEPFGQLLEVTIGRDIYWQALTKPPVLVDETPTFELIERQVDLDFVHWIVRSLRHVASGRIVRCFHDPAFGIDYVDLDPGIGRDGGTLHRIIDTLKWSVVRTRIRSRMNFGIAAKLSSITIVTRLPA